MASGGMRTEKQIFSGALHKGRTEMDKLLFYLNRVK